MKLINALLILLLMKISCVYSIKKWEIRYKMLKGYPEWKVVISSLHNDSSCDVLPLRKQLFIAEADCVHSALSRQNGTDTEIYINRGRAYRKNRITSIRRNRIFFNEDLSPKYNKSKRGIAMLITDKPIFHDADRQNLKKSPWNYFDEIKEFDREFELFKLPNNTFEVNYSNCLVPATHIFNVKVGPCFFAAKSMWCRSDSELRVSQYANFTINFVFCLMNHSANDVVVGILPEFSRREFADFQGDFYVKIEYLADLRTTILEKYNSWLAGRNEKSKGPSGNSDAVF